MALFPPQYLDALISVEVDAVDAAGKLVKQPIASAFLYGAYLGFSDSAGNKRYLGCLVTNRHVFQNLKTGEYLKSVYLRLNAESGAQHYKFELLEGGKPTWSAHQNAEVDLAVLPLRGAGFIENAVKYFLFTDDQFVIRSGEFDDLGIAPGQGVFMLGFPRGIRGDTKNRVIVRHGIVSRVDEEILSRQYFYIDAAAYPGNSGGPVITKPEMVAIEGTKAFGQAKLIGVVSAGEPYSDVAISAQTGEPRVIFQEQMGLVRIVPVELIDEVIAPIVQKLKPSIEREFKGTVSEERTEGVDPETK